MTPANLQNPPILPEKRDAWTEAVNQLVNRTEAEMLASRARVMKNRSLGRPLPEGKTIADVLKRDCVSPVG